MKPPTLPNEKDVVVFGASPALPNINGAVVTGFESAALPNINGAAGVPVLVAATEGLLASPKTNTPSRLGSSLGPEGSKLN